MDKVKGEELSKIDLRSPSWIKDPNTDIIYKFTPNELKCWKFYKKGLSKTKAYKKVFPGLSDKSTMLKARYLFKKKKFYLLEQMENKKQENMWERYKEIAPEALDIQTNLMKSKKTKDELRSQIADKLQDRAGFSPVQKNAQLRLNVNIDNPNELKSSDELIRMFEDTTKFIKQLEKDLTQRDKIKIKRIETIKNE